MLSAYGIFIVYVHWAISKKLKKRKHDSYSRVFYRHYIGGGTLPLAALPLAEPERRGRERADVVCTVSAEQARRGRGRTRRGTPDVDLFTPRKKVAALR